MHKRTMKKNRLTTLFFLFLFTQIKAQVIIAEESNYPTDITESSLLQFEDDTSKGIILPANNTEPENSANGTIIFDRLSERVKMFENEKWVNLSDTGKAPALLNENDLGKGVIIGADTSMADGVLVLESSDKALVLPRINNVNTDVINPYPGMICYDLATKTVTIFDGIQWNYWN